MRPLWVAPQVGRSNGAFNVIGVPHLNIGIQGIRVRKAVGVAVTTGAMQASGALYAAPAQAAAAPTIAAKGGFVMNDVNGKSLYTKAADTRRSTGSTTKIMTAKVVLAQKNLNLDAKVTIQMAYSDYIVANNASSARLIVGDKTSPCAKLLYGLMLPSGCQRGVRAGRQVRYGLDAGRPREVLHRQDERRREEAGPDEHQLRLVRRHRQGQELLHAA
ncbi:hypothetical protein SHIRM173S_04009 [Streptomyces hirsutus]